MRKLAVLFLGACGSSTPGPAIPLATIASAPAPSASAAPSAIESRHPPTACGGPTLRVRFFDVAQALSALVELPDGRRILVDTGDIATRNGCGPTCQTAHTHLARELAGKSIDMLWITHQHSDHIGGAVDLFDHVIVKQYVDNGRDLTGGQIKKTHDALATKNIRASVIDPTHTQIPIPDAGDVKLSAIVPAHWPSGCNQDENLCSILLRIDYCASSMLFTGDADAEEESVLDTKGNATLLQIGHHGSDTSSTPAFLTKVAPKYAVISAGKKGEGMNKGYCHPRQSTVRAVSHALGAAGGRTILSFDAKVRCDRGTDANWIDEPVSDHFWATERDGDVTLSTTGNGTFARE